MPNLEVDFNAYMPTFFQFAQYFLVFAEKGWIEKVEFKIEENGIPHFFITHKVKEPCGN